MQEPWFTVEVLADPGEPDFMLVCMTAAPPAWTDQAIGRVVAGEDNVEIRIADTAWHLPCHDVAIIAGLRRRTGRDILMAELVDRRITRSFRLLVGDGRGDAPDATDGVRD